MTTLQFIFVFVLPIVVLILSIASNAFRAWFWGTLIWDSIRNPINALRRFLAALWWLVRLCVAAWLITWIINELIAHFFPGYGIWVFPSPLEIWYMGAGAASGSESFNLFKLLDELISGAEWL